MNDPELNQLTGLRRSRFSRRSLLKGSAAMASLPLLATLGIGCGDDDDDDSESSGDATATSAASAAGAAGSATAAGETLKVGIMHSLTGVMAISEKAVVDAEQLAIEEINAAGGVLGMQLEAIVEDGASAPATFTEKARKLVESDGVPVVFGCWTSASRKAVRDTFADSGTLLFYPVQYEGLEQDANIYYMGATTNQQIVPSVEYLLEEGKTRFFLLGSDYVFPRTANQIIKAQLEASGGEVLAEEYVPLDYPSGDFSTIISKIKSAEPDVVYNTLNGESNVSFFKQLRDEGITAADLTTLSVSIAEEEARAIGGDIMEGHLVAWNYYQTTATPENEAFVAAYKAKYGDDRVTADPIEAAYIGVHIWAQAANAAGSVDVPAVKEALAGLEFAAPGGPVVVNGENDHISKTVRIGQIRSDALIDEIWATPAPVEPDPFLLTYPWATEFHDLAPA